jgi:hypothetical protein
VAAFCYGTLPNLWPQLLAYSLYRWENNIRMASVLGFVGAGGLGQMLYTSLSLFQEAQGTVIIAMLVLVLLVDAFSACCANATCGLNLRRHAPGVAALFLPRRRRTVPVECLLGLEGQCGAFLPALVTGAAGGSPPRHGPGRTGASGARPGRRRR